MDGRGCIDVAVAAARGSSCTGDPARGPQQSAQAYQKIWTPEGSPLVVTSRNVQAELQRRAGDAGRTGHALSESVHRRAPCDRLQRQGVEQLLAHSRCFRTTRCRASKPPWCACEEVAARLAPAMRSQIVEPPYYDDPDYIAALVASAAEHLQAGYDHLLFSFHGLPERHLRKSDPTGQPLSARSRLLRSGPARRTHLLPGAVLRDRARPSSPRRACPRYSVAFQSRLGRDPVAAALHRPGIRPPGPGRREAPARDLPGVRRRLPRDARGNRHARPGDLPRRRRPRIRPRFPV